MKAGISSRYRVIEYKTFLVWWYLLFSESRVPWLQNFDLPQSKCLIVGNFHCWKCPWIALHFHNQRGRDFKMPQQLYHCQTFPKVYTREEYLMEQQTHCNRATGTYHQQARRTVSICVFHPMYYSCSVVMNTLELNIPSGVKLSTCHLYFFWDKYISNSMAFLFICREPHPMKRV